MRKIVRVLFMFFVFWVIFCPGYAFGEQKYIKLANGVRAIIYFPKRYQKKFRYKRYPMLITLHGIRETSEQSLARWKRVADHLDMILVCPRASSYQKGYTRVPRDDRRQVSYLWDYMTTHYRINKKKSVLVGFSRGGHIAVEIGLIYPSKFRNIVCIFGFFGNRHISMVKSTLKRHRNAYRRSKFYFITGKQDLTRKASNLGYKTLNGLNINTRIKTYPTLLHEIPEDIEREIGWFIRK